jgi:gas vesicle protein
MTTQRMHSNAFRIATFAGIAGASLALLLAPRSGRETRDRIKLRANTMRHQAEDKIETAKQTVEERAHAAMEMKDRAAQAVIAGKQSAREKYEELRHKESQDMETSMPSDLTSNSEEEV